MDNFTEEFNPHHQYENFETYVKLNMDYLAASEGYKFYKIDSELSNLLLNKSLIDDEKYREYADLLKKYEADFTYDCEDSIEGYDDITGKFGKVCRVAFYPKREITLSYKDVSFLMDVFDDAYEHLCNLKLSYKGCKDLEEQINKKLERCDGYMDFFNKFIWESRDEKN